MVGSFHFLVNAALTVWFIRLRQRSALLLPDELNVRLRDMTVCVHIIGEVLLIGLLPLWLLSFFNCLLGVGLDDYGTTTVTSLEQSPESVSQTW